MIRKTKIIFLFLSLISLFSKFTYGSDISELSKETPGIDLYLFHSEECGVCKGFVPGLVSRLKTMYPSLKIHLLNLKIPKNYNTLRHFEKIIGKRGNELPIAVIGNHLLSGEKEFEEKLDSIILKSFLSGPDWRKISLEEIPGSTTVSSSPEKISVELIYFSQSGCVKCGRTKVLLDYLTQKYPGLSVKTIDLSVSEGKLIAEVLAERLNLPEKFRLSAPAILIGNTFLPSKEISEEKIEKVLLSLSGSNDKKNSHSLIIDLEKIKKAEKSIIERFKTLGPIPVALGGLLDGINPCAFATIIFLVSYLTTIGSKKNNILKVGLGFTVSVFIAYLLIGMGIISFIQKFSFVPLLSRMIYLLALSFAIAMGILSFYDFLLWKKGKEQDMKLQLPKTIKKLIHKTIRKIEFSKYHLTGAIFLGFIVSLLEFTCTGQIYLPTIIFVMGVSEFRKNALLYLLLYNLAFIVPLLLIFTFFYLGINQRRFSLFLQKRGALVKLLTSVFFFSLGVMMLFTAF